MPRGALGLAAALLFCAGGAAAQAADDGSCIYNRDVYPAGTEMCQSGNLVRCEDGAWSDVGDCPDQPMPEPNTRGGDVDEEED